MAANRFLLAALVTMPDRVAWLNEVLGWTAVPTTIETRNSESERRSVDLIVDVS